MKAKEYNPINSPPRVFISYAYSDGEESAKELN